MSRLCSKHRLAACFAGVVVAVALAQPASAQLTTLWDTGIEHAFNSGAACPCGGTGQPACTDFFLGYSSGAISGAPQRWAAQPFSITNASGAIITEVDIHGFYPAGNEPQDINII